jgi:hypothetical protein
MGHAHAYVLVFVTDKKLVLGVLFETEVFGILVISIDYVRVGIWKRTIWSLVVDSV